MSKRDRTALAKSIDEFLTERRKSDGGYAPVTELDFNQLCTIIDRIVKMKWSKDPDGDLPIEVEVIDRTRFEPMHYAPVPYEHEVKNALEQGQRLSIVLMNSQIASRELDITLRNLQFKLRKKPEILM